MTIQTKARVERQKRDFMAGFLMDAETSCVYYKEARGTRYPITAPRIQMVSQFARACSLDSKQTAIPDNILRLGGFSKKDFVNFLTMKPNLRMRTFLKSPPGNGHVDRHGGEKWRTTRHRAEDDQQHLPHD